MGYMERGKGCKVDALIRKYELSAGGRFDGTIDQHLVARWRGDEGFDAEGYRPLTDWFNKRLLKKRYDGHGRSTITARLDSEYEVLVGDEEIARQELAHDLESSGIDAEELRSDMISWSTMRHHLKGCLDAEKGAGDEPKEWERESLDVIRDGTEMKVRKVVNSLASKGKIADAEDALVDVDIRLSCPKCPTRATVEEAIERGYICERHASDADPDVPESLLSSE